MAKKFYAVRKGHEPGIYTDWPAAEAQIKGFKGAEFKGFATRTLAEGYLAENAGEVELTKEEKMDVYRDLAAAAEEQAVASSKELGTLAVYSDGSNKKDEGRSAYGYGFVIIDDGSVVAEESGAGNHPQLVALNNIAGELTGVVEALRWIEKHRPGTKRIVLFPDLEGIIYWGRGEWKTNNEVTRRYRQFIVDFEKRTGATLEFHHVKGHCKNRFNERCDELAGSAVSDFLQKVR